MATTQQLQRPGALLERCSGQEAPVAAAQSAGVASGQGAVLAAPRNIVEAIVGALQKRCTGQESRVAVFSRAAGALQWPVSICCSVR